MDMNGQDLNVSKIDEQVQTGNSNALTQHKTELKELMKAQKNDLKQKLNEQKIELKKKLKEIDGVSNESNSILENLNKLMSMYESLKIEMQTMEERLKNEINKK